VHQRHSLDLSREDSPPRKKSWVFNWEKKTWEPEFFSKKPEFQRKTWVFEKKKTWGFVKNPEFSKQRKI